MSCDRFLFGDYIGYLAIVIFITSKSMNPSGLFKFKLNSDIVFNMSFTICPFVPVYVCEVNIALCTFLKTDILIKNLGVTSTKQEIL